MTLQGVLNERLLLAKSTSTDIPCLGSREQWTLRRDPVNQNAPSVCPVQLLHEWMNWCQVPFVCSQYSYITIATVTQVNIIILERLITTDTTIFNKRAQLSCKFICEIELTDSGCKHRAQNRKQQHDLNSSEKVWQTTIQQVLPENVMLFHSY